MNWAKTGRNLRSLLLRILPAMLLPMSAALARYDDEYAMPNIVISAYVGLCFAVEPATERWLRRRRHRPPRTTTRGAIHDHVTAGHTMAVVEELRQTGAAPQEADALAEWFSAITE